MVTCHRNDVHHRRAFFLRRIRFNVPHRAPKGGTMNRAAYAKPWLPITAQIKKLESRGLIIDHQGEAEEFLWHLNYYRFSGYCLAFEDSRHCFRSGTTFSHIRSAYDFDVKLRDLLTEGLEVIEVDTRSAIAHIVGEKCGAFGYVDPTGRLAIMPKYEDAGVFSDGLAQVRSNGRWGYIDTEGKFAITPLADAATPFRDGLALVVNEGKWQYIDRFGGIVWKEV